MRQFDKRSIELVERMRKIPAFILAQAIEYRREKYPELAKTHNKLNTLLVETYRDEQRPNMVKVFDIINALNDLEKSQVLAFIYNNIDK